MTSAPSSSNALRQAFLDYFASKGHAVVPSSSLVPGDDPTLLFTNAGMVQFKNVFLGQEQRPYTRAASSQRCVRAGGKHNDLENVGYTARHHTFFEMLGNFSFGDYFKRNAIAYGWEFLTQVLRLPPEKLWVTVYQDDDEAADIWLNEIGIPAQRLSRIGDKPGAGKYNSDNFWQMGDTGPCGPCSEIFYDHGPDIFGGPPGSPDADGDRYIEIWNLVFMQYERFADGSMKPLPKPSVDTGMGLERLAAVMQHVHSNYEIDLFTQLIRAAQQATHCADPASHSLRVIADHIRSCAFLIVDGVMPSNEGRGYVLRRIIRRAIRHGYKLGQTQPFFYTLIDALAQEMGDAYPDLLLQRDLVARVLHAEEERFAQTLEHGMKVLEEDLAQLTDKTIPGATIFKLYDTYGFPVDLTNDIARERGLLLDMDGFEAQMQAQRTRARAAGQFGVDYTQRFAVSGNTDFTGYEHLSDTGRLLAIQHAGTNVTALNAGEQGVLILDRTPFYAESGGQAGDRGLIRLGDSIFEVRDTLKQGAGLHVHSGTMISGVLRVGDEVTAVVDAERRRAIALNHSATHLLHAALRKILGTHVQQKGSLVEPTRLRFDFSHFEPLTPEQIKRIETLINAQIRANHPAQTRVLAYEQALQAGALAFFGEKYGDTVRVLSIGEFSTELCGGTHVERAGDIGVFRILSESGVAAGVRRIEAVTGVSALESMAADHERLARIAAALKAGPEVVEEKVQQLLEQLRRTEKELEQLKGKLASNQGSDLVQRAVDLNGVKTLIAQLDNADPKSLRDVVDQLKNKLGSAVILLAAVQAGKISLVAGVTADQTARVKAGELVNLVASHIGGKGGGRPDMAQGGGENIADLPAALENAWAWLRSKL